MTTRRSSVGVGVVGSFLYAVGGYDGAQRQCLSSVERYDPDADEWTKGFQHFSSINPFLFYFSLN